MRTTLNIDDQLLAETVCGELLFRRLLVIGITRGNEISTGIG